MCTAANRAYLAPCLRQSAQIPLWETSDTPGTLYDLKGDLSQRFRFSFTSLLLSHI
jgi:hypothetical protein